MHNHIPENATKITGQYSGPKVYFHVWEYGNIYIWDALGNQGEGRTKEEAIARARDYIMYGSSYERTGYGYDYSL